MSPKTVTLRIREEDLRLIDRTAEERGLSRTKYMVEAALYKAWPRMPVREALSVVEEALRKAGALGAVKEDGRTKKTPR